jgi:hypothetical protein
MSSAFSFPRRSAILVVFLAVGLVLMAPPSAQAAVRHRAVTTWASRYDGPAGKLDQVTDLAVSPDGTRVFVTGEVDSCYGNCQFATVAYDAATGAELWVALFDGGGTGLCTFDEPYAVEVSPNSAWVFVAGTSCVHGGGESGIIIAYDAATGTQLYASRFSPAGVVDMKISRDGTRLYITESLSIDGFETIAFEASNGDRLWSSIYPGHGLEATYPNALAVSPDGSEVVVTGTTYTGTYTQGSNYATVAYSSDTGKQLWVSEYDGPTGSEDYANAVVVSPNSATVFVTGEEGQLAWDYGTVAYDAKTGAQLWSAEYVGPGTVDDARDIGISPDGSQVYVTGESQASDFTYDYATIAYDAASGAQLWLTRYDGPKGEDDLAVALAVSPRGNQVFVTGSSTGIGTGLDFATVAYKAATGDQVWVLRYDGPAHREDDAVAIGVSLDGRSVFVAGTSSRGGTNSDFATQARIS